MLEMRFNSTLYSINPDKWSFTGTRKFEGDFFDFIENKFGKKLIRYIRGAIDIKGNLLCPERFTHPDLPNYVEELQQGKKDLDEIRGHIGEYAWFSEYQQDPHPVTGDVWDHVEFEDIQDSPVNRKYDLCFISIDRATTTKRTSDYTGCVVGFRHVETGIRLITHDFTDHIPLEELLIKVNDFVSMLRDKYSTIRILLIVEKQGGGDDFIEMARNRREFLVAREDGLKRIKNRIPGIAAIIEVHNTGEKSERIKNRLYLPIINKQIKFMFYLRKSEIVKEILTYPHSGKLDAIDALATAEFEVQKHPLQGGLDDLKEIIEILEKRDPEDERLQKGLPRHIKNIFNQKPRSVF
jgi:phage terminase large subunit-like protein